MKLGLCDNAYNEHYHGVETIDKLLKEKRYTHPSQLTVINDCEYRTIFVNEYTGLALFLTTCVQDPENFSILMCSTRDVEKYSGMATDKIPGKKFRLKELGGGLTKEDREKSLCVGLVKLGLIPEPKAEKRKIEDAVVTRSDGVRVLDYGRLNRRPGGNEETVLNYAEINKVRKT